MLILAHFPANFPKFQIFLKQSIFVVQKRLVYEKTFSFDGEYDTIKIEVICLSINQFTQVYIKKVKNENFEKL